MERKNITLIDGPYVETIWNAGEARIRWALEKVGLPAEFMLVRFRNLPDTVTTVNVDVPTVKEHLRSIGVLMSEELEPRREHDQRRANAIHEAVNRKVAAGQPIPVVWITEYNELVNHIHVPTVFDTAKDDGDEECTVSDGFGDVEIIHLESWWVPICGVKDELARTTKERKEVTCFACKQIMGRDEE